MRRLSSPLRLLRASLLALALSGCGLLALPLSRVEVKEPLEPRVRTPLAQVMGPMEGWPLRNRHPLVLVGGLLGWGREELPGLWYWGGRRDLQAALQGAGFRTITPSLGPLDSNWDRAVSLYYQLKGGCLDYGEDHSARFGHARATGQCFGGLYPEWDERHPLHLIGHSMGGQTARALASLLADGWAEERRRPGHAPLFDGGRAGWVASVTTVSTSNLGTPAAEMPHALLLLRELLGLARVLGATEPSQAGGQYNFGLDQWGLRRREGERLDGYLTRTLGRGLGHSQDSGLHDLTTAGAAELNRRVRTVPGVYYFSLETADTLRSLRTGWEYPQSGMTSVMNSFAAPAPPPRPPGLGNVLRRTPGTVPIDPRWWRNDGLVPLVSQGSPDGPAPLLRVGTQPRPGRWTDLGLLDGYDHFDVTGLTGRYDVSGLYRALAGLLGSLPPAHPAAAGSATR